MDHPSPSPAAEAAPVKFAVPAFPGEGLSDVTPTFGRLAIVDRQQAIEAIDASAPIPATKCMFLQISR